MPLIVSLLVTSIGGEQKSGLVARLGGRIIGLFVIMIGGVCVYTVILGPPLLSFLHIDPAIAATLLESTESAGAAVTELPPFRDWLVALIPTNPLKAAVDSAMLPLVVFTVLFSLALLRIEGHEKDTILRFFTAIKDAMFVLIGWIMLIAPVGVFALVFPLAARMGLSAVTVIGTFIVITCSMISLMMLLLYPLAVVIGRVPLGAFARAVAPVQVIGFSTRSSLASLPATFAATEALDSATRVSHGLKPWAGLIAAARRRIKPGATAGGSGGASTNKVEKGWVQLLKDTLVGLHFQDNPAGTDELAILLDGIRRRLRAWRRRLAIECEAHHGDLRWQHGHCSHGHFRNIRPRWRGRRRRRGRPAIGLVHALVRSSISHSYNPGDSCPLPASATSSSATSPIYSPIIPGAGRSLGNVHLPPELSPGSLSGSGWFRLTRNLAVSFSVAARPISAYVGQFLAVCESP